MPRPPKGKRPTVETFSRFARRNYGITIREALMIPKIMADFIEHELSAGRYIFFQCLGTWSAVRQPQGFSIYFKTSHPLKKRIAKGFNKNFPPGTGSPEIRPGKRAVYKNGMYIKIKRTSHLSPPLEHGVQIPSNDFPPSTPAQGTSIHNQVQILNMAGIDASGGHIGGIAGTSAFFGATPAAQPGAASIPQRDASATSTQPADAPHEQPPETGSTAIT